MVGDFTTIINLLARRDEVMDSIILFNYNLIDIALADFEIHDRP